MRSFRVVALMLCLSVVLLPLLVEAGAPVQPRAWKGRFYMGSGLAAPFQDDSQVVLTVGRQSILCETEGGAGFLIPLQQVVGVTYDNVVMRRYHAWEAAAWLPYQMYEGWRREGGLFYARDHAHYLDVLLWYGSTWALTETFKSKDHFVNILWKDGDRAKEAIFELGKKHYRSFLDRLQDATGKTWLDLPGARKSLRRDLEEHRDQAIPVQLDRAIAYKEVLLQPGPYQLILLQREKHWALSFFRGREVDSREVVLVVPVEVVAEDEEEGGAAEVIFGEHSNGQLPSISEIRVGGRVLRFP